MLEVRTFTEVHAVYRGPCSLLASLLLYKLLLYFAHSTSLSSRALALVKVIIFFIILTLHYLLSTSFFYPNNNCILTMCDATKKDQSSANTASASRSETTLIATENCAPEQIEIDIRNLSEKDLQSLKQDDPFLYYSIPAVRRASFNQKAPDIREASWKESTIVKRRARVSFECHTNLLMEDLMMGDFEEEYDQSELEQMDLEFSKLLGLAYAGYSKKTRN